MADVNIYGHDSLGKLISTGITAQPDREPVTYKADGEDNTRYYYMDGHVLYTESDVAIQPEEGDSSGDGAGSGEEDPTETKITSLNILSPEGGLTASGREGENSDEYFVYTKDVRRSTVNILDDAGAAAASYTYSDFGETTANNRTAGDGTVGEPPEFYNEICYTGGMYDEKTGEYYLNARYYDPPDGRFTTQDSYRGENTDEGTWNLYAYCANNPMMYVDPSGHKKILSIYYNGTKSGSLKKFSKKPWYYKKSQSDYRKANTYKQLKKVWNKKLKKKYKKVFIYIHGGKGCIYFHEKPQEVSAKKLREDLGKKKSVKKLYLLICKGAKGGEKSVAYAFHKKAYCFFFAFLQHYQ